MLSSKIRTFQCVFIEIYITVDDIKITWRPYSGTLYPRIRTVTARLSRTSLRRYHIVPTKKKEEEEEGKICDAPNVTVSFRTRSSKFAENRWTRLSGKLRIVRKRRFWTPSMTVITLTSRQPSSRGPSKDSLVQHGSISRERFQQRRPEDAIREAKERTMR